MKRYLGEVTLRKPYKVLRCGDKYLVERHVAADRVYTTRVSSSHVDLVTDIMAGQRIKAEDVLDALVRLGNEDGVPGGHHARFYADKVLIVLIALGKATKLERGRRLLYDIEG